MVILKPTVAHRPLWRLAWRRLRQRPLQYVLLVFGVAIGVAMMVSIDLANGSARRAFQLSTDAITGRTTHHIVGGPLGLDEDVYRQLRQEVGFSPTAPVVDGYVKIDQMGSRPLRLVGIDPFAEPPFRPYFNNAAQDTTSLAAFLTEPNAIILSQPLADQHGVKLGDRLTLSLSGVPTAVHVVGLLQPTDTITSRALDSVLFADIASAQELLGMVGQLSHIDLIVHDATDLAAIRAILPSGTRLETAAAQQNAVVQMTTAFTLNLTALSLLALVVGMFLIYNTVTFSVVQRRPLFGILRCLGVTGQQLFSLIMAETAVLGLVGALLGLALGIMLGQGMVRLITQTINDFYFVVNVETVSISPSTLLKGLVIGTLAAIAAALPPAWEAMGTTPQSNLRRSVLESKVQRLLPWLLLAWGVLTALGVLLLWLRAGGLVAAFSGLFAILIAATLLTPAITVWLMRGLMPLMGGLFGVLGRMAPRDIVRSLSRTSVAIAALMTAVAVVVGVSIMIGSFRQTVVQWLDQTLQADIYLSPPSVAANRPAGVLQPEIVTAVRAWPGVASVAVARPVEVYLPELQRQVQLLAVDNDVSQGQRPYAWKQQPDEDPWLAMASGEGIIVSEALVLKENLPVPPPPLVLETAVGARTFPVLAILYDYANDRGTIFISQPLYARLWQDNNLSSLAVFVQPGVDVDKLVMALQAEFAGQQDLLIRANQTLRRSSIDVFDRTFAITSALRLLAIVVAFIGVLSALMSLQLEQTQELGILRANGMTVAQLWALTLLKTGLMGATAGLLAMPVGYVLAWILIYVINVRSFGWTLQMQLQPGYFLQALAVAVVAALLAAVYPSWRLGKLVIATAIRQE